MGKEVRKVIPSCVAQAIRNSNPLNNGKFTSFTESKEEEKRLLQEKGSKLVYECLLYNVIKCFMKKKKIK